MKWVPLYVLTALVTGLFNFYALMSVVNGAPIYLLNLISLLGSATLFSAAVLLALRLRSAAKVGLWGSILSWVFYAPFMVVSFFRPFSIWRNIRLDISFRDYMPLVGELVGPVLLVLCTTNSIILLRRSRVISQTVL